MFIYVIRQNYNLHSGQEEEEDEEKNNSYKKQYYNTRIVKNDSKAIYIVFKN